LIFSIISIFGGGFMIIYMGVIDINIQKPYYIYIMLILLGLIGFRIYRKERA